MDADSANSSTNVIFINIDGASYLYRANGFHVLPLSIARLTRLMAASGRILISV